jgi:hypothetical protein
VGDLSALLVNGSVGTIALASWWWLARQVFTGRLIPRQQLLDVTADRDHYREAVNTFQQVTLEQGMTLEKLLETSEKLLANDDAILHVVQEVQRAGGGP